MIYGGPPYYLCGGGNPVGKRDEEQLIVHMINITYRKLGYPESNLEEGCWACLSPDVIFEQLSTKCTGVEFTDEECLQRKQHLGRLGDGLAFRRKLRHMSQSVRLGRRPGEGKVLRVVPVAQQ